MNAKNYLVGFFTLLAFSGFAQTEKNPVPETKNAVTEFSVKTSDLDELKNFDWTVFNEMFGDNDKDQEITLAFTYLNNAETDKPKIRVDNFSFKVSGKTADLEKLTARLKKSLERLTEIKDI